MSECASALASVAPCQGAGGFLMMMLVLTVALLILLPVAAWFAR